MTLVTAFDLPFWFEFAATVTGGLSGGMSAVRARYDIFGTVAIACITGMGGGIIRDILLKRCAARGGRVFRCTGAAHPTVSAQPA
ncbi:TRIC cation channel family protein, partial [Adlercreutzia rubneri]|uniref:trimeric intracellular cation channel family protein n=1 Tax=Adlercreutzia rubneri TaxID=2916441 RepID=UPI0023AE78B1